MATAGWQGAIVDYPAIADGTTYCITPSLEELAEWHASADGRRKLKAARPTRAITWARVILSPTRLCNIMDVVRTMNPVSNGPNL